MLFIKLDDAVEEIVAAGLRHPGMKHILLHKATVQQSLLEVLPGEEIVRPPDIFVCRLGVLSAFLVSADSIIAKILPQIGETHLLLPRQLRQTLQGQLPQRAVEDICPAHKGGFQIQLLPYNAVQLLRQAVPPEKTSHQPQPGGMALVVHVPPLLALVCNVSRGVAANDRTALPNFLLIPGSVLRHVNHAEVFLKAAGHRPLVSSEGLGQLCLFGNLKDKVLPVELGPFHHLKLPLAVNCKLIGNVQPAYKLL